MLASQHYTPSPVNSIPADNQKYSQYVSTARSQIMYVRDIHNSLVEVASTVANNPSSRSANESMTSMETSN